MATFHQVQLGVSTFVEEEIAKKSVGFNKFATYFMLPSLQTKTTKILNDLHKNELFSDYFVNDNEIDLDKVYKTAKDSIQKSGQFELFGILFNESDIDKLYSIIKRS